MIPPEVRSIVYRKLLVSPEKIDHVASRLGTERVKYKMLNTYTPLAEIDPTILRTCRAIYDEALPILYGENTFYFSRPEKMAAFKKVGLAERNSRFAGYCGLCAPP